MIELRYLRPGRRHVLRVVTPVALALSGSLLAGCSASITRFDNPSFALNDSDTGSVNRSSGGYGGSNLSDQSPDYGRSYTGPVTSTGSSIRSSSLPDIQETQDSYRDQGPSYGHSRDYTRSADASHHTPAADRYNTDSYQSGQNDGQTIVVRSGDTLYSLSRRHNTTVSELMAANGLTSSHLQLGQRLTIPSSEASYAPGRTEYTASPAPARARTYREPSYETPSYEAPSYEPAASRTAGSDWNGTYQVASGDSLYGIARRHGVTSDELQRHNGISDPRRVMPGTVLKVPGSAGGSYAAAEEPAPTGYQPMPGPQRVAALQTYSRTDAAESAPVARPVTDTRPITQTREVRTVSITPAVQNSDTTRSDTARSGSASSGGKLRWPVRGRVIDNFGPRKDGTHNDGVNLAVPMGAEVHAAEDGVVAYAGSELRGYGNLILLRHDNGWVTAYAHNEEISVKRGDKVTRGQVIARAGKTGEVDQPQLHFELRMGSKPVDPLPYLETL